MDRLTIKILVVWTIVGVLSVPIIFFSDFFRINPVASPMYSLVDHEAYVKRLWCINIQTMLLQITDIKDAVVEAQFIHQHQYEMRLNVRLSFQKGINVNDAIIDQIKEIFMHPLLFSIDKFKIIVFDNDRGQMINVFK